MPVSTVHHSPASALMSRSGDLSPALVAFLSLAQDISALVSLSIEAGLSTVHDWLGVALGYIPISRLSARAGTTVVLSGHQYSKAGQAIVILGADEVPGQSLTLQLARAGYTVFPFIPQPSSRLPPTSTALSSLLLAWSTLQRRLRARNPAHTGAVVPVITDSESSPFASGPRGLSISGGRFDHANETVRAYCRENGLKLAAIICVSAEDVRTAISPVVSPSKSVRFSFDVSDRAGVKEAAFSHSHTSADIIQTVQPFSDCGALEAEYQRASSEEQSAIQALFRHNILDPLIIISGLLDLFVPSSTDYRCRVVFVNSGGIGIAPSATPGSGERKTAARDILFQAQTKLIRALRAGLSKSSIGVCEVLVGPITTDFGKTSIQSPILSPSTDKSSPPGKHLLKAAIQSQHAQHGLSELHTGQTTGLARKLELVSRIWAVDDALLYSAVRRALEDRYPRTRHHAGVSPFVQTILEIIPGGATLRMLGRWVLRRLLTSTDRI